MDIDLNSKQIGNLPVLIGSDPVTPEYSPENLTKPPPPHLYLEADICLDYKSPHLRWTKTHH